MTEKETTITATYTIPHDRIALVMELRRCTKEYAIRHILEGDNLIPTVIRIEIQNDR